MKTKITVEIEVQIPGEFQDDALAVSAIARDLEERLEIGYEYEDDMSGEILFKDLKVLNYFVTAGRIKDTND